MRRYTKEIHAGVHLRSRAPVGPSARRLQCLTALGWDVPRLAPETGLHVSVLRRVRLATNPTITQAVAAAIDGAFTRLWDQPAPPGLATDRAVALAARHDWYPAAAYDDIDDMTERPKPGPKDVKYRSENDVDPADEIRRRLRVGETNAAIALAVGVTVRTVERHRARVAAGQQQEEAAS
jgi:hypothetical protein